MTMPCFWLLLCFCFCPAPCHASSYSSFLLRPTFEFRQGDYWGQRACSEASGRCDVPHGNGSYVDRRTGRVLYTGEWWNGRLHGRGSRYFADGRNYTGQFNLSQVHGSGRMEWPNGTVYTGQFVHNRMSGYGAMTYPNGHRRMGYIHNGRWINESIYLEEDDGQRGRWMELWDPNTNSYQPRLKIFKRVTDKYNDITVEVVCKIHSLDPGSVRLYRESQLLMAPNKSRDLNGEVGQLVFRVPFNDEAFKTYACRAAAEEEEDEVEQSGSLVADEAKLQVRNPFFLESHGECGVQYVNPEQGRLRRSAKDDSFDSDDSEESFDSGDSFDFVHSGHPGDSKKPGRSKRTPISPNFMPGRVVMGKDGFRGQVPWQAIIHVVNGTYRGKPVHKEDVCGGTVISPWHILTGAHCLILDPQIGPLAAGQLKVKLGYTSLPHSLNGKVYSVKRVYVHSGYEMLLHSGTGRSTLVNDIALLVLEQKIRLGKYVNPVCLAGQSQWRQIRQNPDAKQLLISGFGMTFNASDKGRGWYFPSRLQVAQIQHQNISTCFPPEMEVERKFEGYFCAGNAIPEGQTHVADSCKGDSGGPVTYREPASGRHYLVGLVSFGHALCGSHPGAVYVNLTAYVPWINRIRLADLVQDYKDNDRALPYKKMDSSVFQAMFDHLSSSVKLQEFL